MPPNRNQENHSYSRSVPLPVWWEKGIHVYWRISPSPKGNSNECLLQLIKKKKKVLNGCHNNSFDSNKFWLFLFSYYSFCHKSYEYLLTFFNFFLLDCIMLRSGHNGNGSNGRAHLRWTHQSGSQHRYGHRIQHLTSPSFFLHYCTMSWSNCWRFLPERVRININVFLFFYNILLTIWYIVNIIINILTI